MNGIVDHAPDLTAAGFLDREFLEPEIETAPQEEIRRLQERRVLELVPYAFERSNFYRELWSAAGISPSDVRSLDDFLNKVPTFGKKDLRAYRERTGDPFGGLLCVDAADLTSISSTSGTTSAPEPLPEIWDVAPPLPAVSARDLWELGLRPGDRVMVPTGTMRNYWDDFYHALGLVPVFVDTWLGQGEQMIKAIKQYAIAYLQLTLPTVMELERLEQKYELKDMLSSLKGASFAGQPLGAVLGAKVREEWGINLFVYTSAGDTGTAWEGREHDGYQLWEDTLLPESLDPISGRPVGDREVGELIATDLDNWAAPYIRFRSEDLIRLTREPAVSGRTHARMWVVGRVGDEIGVGGKAIVLTRYWRHVESLPECSDALFQIVKHAELMDTLHIRIGYAPARTADVDELTHRAAELLQTQLGIRVRAELMAVDKILESSSSVAKFPRVVKP